MLIMMRLHVILAENTTLTDLNLSWNEIRCEGAVAVAEAIRDNVGMKTIALAWNGYVDCNTNTIQQLLLYKTCVVNSLHYILIDSRILVGNQQCTITDHRQGVTQLRLWLLPKCKNLTL